MAVEDMYKTGGLEYVKTFCNEIDGFIYKVLLFIISFLLIALIIELIDWNRKKQRLWEKDQKCKNTNTASNIIQGL